MLCACDRSSEAKTDGAGGGAKLISTDETRRVAMHVLLNRYPQAQIVAERGAGQTWTYRIATNGVVLPVAVVVDRKAAKARFEKVNP